MTKNPIANLTPNKERLQLVCQFIAGKRQGDRSRLWLLVPEGSAYHFFTNRYDLFNTLANRLSEEFVNAHKRPAPAANRRTWQDFAQ